MPRITPYEPGNIPNPASIGTPPVSPKGKGLRSVAESNRAVVDELHKGDYYRARGESKIFDAGVEGLTKVGAPMFSGGGAGPFFDLSGGGGIVMGGGML